ncbi:MAG: hypothetical protein ACLTXM_14395, partial [Enterococcus sp.]
NYRGIQEIRKSAGIFGAYVDRALYPFKFDYTLEEEMFRGNGDRYAIYHVDEDTLGTCRLLSKITD